VPGEAPRRGATPKLTYKEARELERLPGEIEALEQEQRALTAAMSTADYHKRGGEQMRVDVARVAEIERLLEAAFERWSDLDERNRAPR